MTVLTDLQDRLAALPPHTQTDGVAQACGQVMRSCDRLRGEVAAEGQPSYDATLTHAVDTLTLLHAIDRAETARIDTGTVS